ncbi:MAG: molybdenum cofactor guanylyltransferase [Planctomycetes bacterium]|nr:molybdenum cofactor guanylyltransferase [Planctomycetota bacterium]
MNEQAVRVLGIVLCGGRSSRMGRDKAEIEIGGRTLLEHATQTLLAVTDDVRIACGAEARYAQAGFELVLDRERDLGPLGGLEAALATASADWVLAVATDMPRLEARALSRIVDTAQSQALDVCVLRSARGVEPLCGVWRHSMLGAVRRTLARGERRVVRAFDEQLDDGTLPKVGYVDVDDAGCVANVNTPADLARERQDRGGGDEA